ncbi:MULTISPECIES: type II toxin-antitoxin system RelE/ParE family toxin [Candidatus Williamhamiltonella]|uniref:Addiction module toxin RelE n=3 Tax=Candidatus Williamhamiltonella defendens TaxID=138072 RepID=A0A249DZE0_9ENTR|nr:type II toxin-antitoxin system YafQ family toxin [Candidatus Hamiltonella defensa]ACQ67890.1 addiction module toxin [Candidatus Hamiltonella defensa 5AT (Acyrthosiphon pisum)]ASV33091.1 type II toxin-antitoxin system YafQ family toxin [Candidatus Hamiltonella defensa]ASX26916.1 addiction module toxin RelE [Candidatus Hamiltonella defensa (Bemisia tabaci)]ATW22533.1 addiction module toxin RelE [Candidatus Hamiltonella defensa]ATW33831.1 addiction module toxin RelE [Candidatus Hamiltonella de
MLKIVYQSRFKKDAKRYENNKKAQKIILETINLLQTGKPLPKRYKEHSLIGNYIGYIECHGMSDVLLIYQRTDTELKLYRVGSHSDLF